MFELFRENFKEANVKPGKLPTWTGDSREGAVVSNKTQRKELENLCHGLPVINPTLAPHAFTLPKFMFV